MRKLDNNIVAYGEATLHHHECHGAGVAVYDPEDGSNTLLVEAPGGFHVTHQEHNTFSCPPGNYSRRLVSEYDPIQDAVKNVVD